MLVALVGSHGTGKTTVFQRIQSRHPEWRYFSEGVRHQVPSFGYNDPYNIIDEVGIGAFELMNMNMWSVIDPQINLTLETKRHILTDRSAVDNLGYYLALRKSKADFRAERLLRGMAKHYASLIDLFVYFPVGRFPLKGDEMRPDGEEFQKSVDEHIREAFRLLQIPDSKIHHLKSAGIEERADEVLGLF